MLVSAKQVTRHIPLFLALMLIFATVIFLWWHLQLGLRRYFDADEFAYFHWARQMLTGKRPYIDFLLYVPAGFVFFLMPTFAAATGPTPLLIGRMLQFIVFFGTVGMVSLLFWEVRKSYLALFAGMILAFLPMPFDKLIEVRPDNLATLLVLIGIYLEVRYLKTKKKSVGFLSGIAFGVSLLVLPKTAPNVLVGLAVICLANAKHFKKTLSSLAPYVMGLALPIVLYLLWLMTLGNLELALYSMMQLPFEVNQINKYFIMQPDLFFYPNGLFYGGDGYTRGLVVNHTIWIIALATGTYRLFTPYLTHENQHGIWTQLLLSAGFIVQVAVFVLLIPLRHTQYLIPIAVFIAWYCADFLYLLWERAKTAWAGSVLYAAALLLVVGLLYNVFIEVNTPKLSWTNQKTLDEIAHLATIIPKGSNVLDLDGSTLYFSDPYYACCFPFGQMGPFMSRPLPSLSQALEKTKTNYIYQGQLKRVSTLLPQDQVYINTHFEALGGDNSLLIRKGSTGAKQ